MNTIDEIEAEQDRKDAAAYDAAMADERDTQAAHEDAAFARKHGGLNWVAQWYRWQDDWERDRPERERRQQEAQEQAERDRVEAERIKQEATAERERLQQVAREQAEAKERRDHDATYGPPPAYRGKLFGVDFDTTTPEREAVETAAYNYPHSKTGNMVIAGPVGTGKTWALACLYGELNERNYRPVFITANELVRQYRQKAMPDAELNARYGQGKYVYFLGSKSYWQSHVLMIDDLGIDGDRFAAETIREILDRRMGESLPTVVTTNATDSELRDWLGERGYSRLMQGCKWTTLGGDDRRLRPNA